MSNKYCGHASNMRRAGFESNFTHTYIHETLAYTCEVVTRMCNAQTYKHLCNACANGKCRLIHLLLTGACML